MSSDRLISLVIAANCPRRNGGRDVWLMVRAVILISE